MVINEKIRSDLKTHLLIIKNRMFMKLAKLKLEIPHLAGHSKLDYIILKRHPVQGIPIVLPSPGLSRIY